MFLLTSKAVAVACFMPSPGVFGPLATAQRAAAILDIIREWFALFLEFNRLAAGEIKRHPEVETLLGQPWATVVRWSGESRPSEQGKLKFVTLGR